MLLLDYTPSPESGVIFIAADPSCFPEHCGNAVLAMAQVPLKHVPRHLV